MAVLRDKPYGNQHFEVDFGDGNKVGFSEIVMPSIEMEVIEYRSGSDKENNVQKIAGLSKSTDVTLKRGVVGALNLYEWIDDVRNGNTNARRTVTISLLSEDLTQVVLTWKLLRAWPRKYSASDLNAKGTNVLIEELVLTYDRLEIE